MITIAIGDIHGCAERLRALLSSIDHWARQNGDPERRLLFIGDLIDRGPDSAGVVEIVRELGREGAICLRGNHEQLAIDCLNSDHAMQTFLINGGEATCASFRNAEDFQEAQVWMQTLPTFWEDEQRYFVHAGIDPNELLSEQTDRDRLWIRKPFLTHEGAFEKYVVHGHTPTATLGLSSAKPHVTPFRCNLDTGAVYGGTLSAAIFDNNRQEPIHTISV
jgi:serine/threonine protein phosphatase 1